MAPTGSDGTTTDLAGPDTANSSPDDASSNSDTPFGDWREQLRERVKEIRARKHAVHREDVDEIAMKATAATEDKLEAARAQSAEPQSVDDLSVQLVDGERANRRADIADLVDDLLGGPEPAELAATDPVEPAAEEAAAEAVAEEPAMEPVAGEPVVEVEPGEPVGETAAAPEAAPLFQEDPTVYADDPILEIADEFEHRAENAEAFEPSDGAATETNLIAAVDALIEPEVEPEPEQPDPDALAASEDDVEDEPATNADEIPEEPALPINNTPLDAIPPELRDVDIPAWALPREPSRTPRASANTVPADSGGDNFLVGEYTTHQGGKRTDLGPPPDTPIPTADLLDKSIGDLSAASEQALSVEEMEIAPPGALVDAADFEPGDREEVPEAINPLPGLFDLEDEPHGEDTAKPSLFFDKPLARTPAPLEIPEDAGAASAEDEPTEVTAAQPSTPVPFLDETMGGSEVAESSQAKKREPIGFFGDPAADAEQAADTVPAETVDDGDPTPGLSLDPDVTSEEPFEVVADEAPTPSPKADEVDATTAEGRSATSGPAESESLEWDIDDDVDAERVADAQRQFADSSAPMSDRVYSAVADAMVLLTIGLVLMIAGASAAGSPVVSFVRAAPIPFLAAWSLFGLVYGVIFVGTCGQTLGKMAMRIRVIGADTFHVGYGRAALRAIAYAAATLPAGLGLLTAIKDPQHRGLHDRLTSTRVVKA